MKIFNRTDGNRVHIYFCGIKVASWRSKNPRAYVCKDKQPTDLIGCDIYNYKQLVENGTIFPHRIGIVISRAAKIGKNCIIYQNVTIGSKDFATGDYTNTDAYPKIGNNVTIYAGAAVLGPVKIGDNAIIGANAVVISDIPPNCIAVGVPARIIKQKK